MILQMKIITTNHAFFIKEYLYIFFNFLVLLIHLFGIFQFLLVTPRIDAKEKQQDNMISNIFFILFLLHQSENEV